MLIEIIYFKKQFMLNNLIKNIHWLEYVIGIFVYFLFISNYQLSLGIIWLIFILYAWTITSFLIQEYTLQSFLYTLSSMGIIVALTIFFMHGVEEVPFPKGAIQFKLDGIAQSLIIFFIFTIPLIIINHKSEQTAFSDSSEFSSPTLPPVKKEEISPSSEIITERSGEEWEEATIEDLESGNFEPI